MASGNAPRPTLMTRSRVLVATRMASTESDGLLQGCRGEDTAGAPREDTVPAAVAAARTGPVQAMPVARTAATTTARATCLLSSPTAPPPNAAAVPKAPWRRRVRSHRVPLGHERIGVMPPLFTTVCNNRGRDKCEA